MDVVTHGLIGGLVARAVMARPAWPLAAATVSGALAPDLDVVARLWDPLAPITVHRTVTHSLLGGVPLATGLAAILRLSSPRESFASLAGLAYLGLLSHIGLDLLTPFGTAVLWPLDPRRLALGWLYVIDPIVLGIAAFGLLWVAMRRPHAPQIARAGLAILVVYIVAAGMMATVAARDFARVLRAERIDAVRAAVVPVFPGPLRWVGVAATGDAIFRSRFWIGRPPDEPLQVFQQETAADRLGEVDGLPEVRVFLDFARFPWRTHAREGGAQIVEYRDLAFEDHPFGGPMVLRLHLDRSGAVRAVNLGHRL